MFPLSNFCFLLSLSLFLSFSLSLSSSRPLSTIETDQSVTLIKAYGDHTVVMRVPTSKTGNEDDHNSSKEKADGGNDDKGKKIATGDGSIALENKSVKGDDQIVDAGGE